MKYYYVVYSAFFNGHEVADPKIVTEHPLLVPNAGMSPVLFWQEISKEIATQRKDLWISEEN